MSSPALRLATAQRNVLQPVAWVIESGWLRSNVTLVTAATDEQAAESVLGGTADLALVDPVIWARRTARLRMVPRRAVATGPQGDDFALLAAVRPDELETVEADGALRAGSEEAVISTLARAFYGVPAPVEWTPAPGFNATRGAVLPLLRGRLPEASYVEGGSKAWWLFTGAPYVRALLVESAQRDPQPAAETLFAEIESILGAQGETVASALARAGGGEEEQWLRFIRAMTLSYGAEERKGLGHLLEAAARLRLGPNIAPASLPRY